MMDEPMNDASRMEIVESERNLCDVESDDLLLHRAESIEMKAQISSQHQVEDHEEILIVLKGEAQIADEGAVDLLEETALLNDVADGSLLRTGRGGVREGVAKKKGKVATFLLC